MGNSTACAEAATATSAVRSPLGFPGFAACAPDLTSWLGGTGSSRSSTGGRFVDGAFPPLASSLGTPRPGRHFIPEEKLAKARWIRLPELMRMNGWVSDNELVGEPRLDWDSVEPSDLAQGWLGNCWLIASVAALAEHPSAVRGLFVEADVGAGRYVVRIYDMGRAQWEHVEVDDYIPCSHEADWSGVAHKLDESGGRIYRYEDVYTDQGLLKVPGVWQPLFARPKGGKVWAILLEKAIAKFVGSYALLAGGSEPFALTAFTGFPLVYCFQRPAGDEEETWAAVGSWNWRGAQYMGRDMTGHSCTSLPGAPASLVDREMWAKLCEYSARSFPMTASITKYQRPEATAGYFRADGLISGHAYSLLASRCAVDSCGKTVRLLLLRDPHGGCSVGHDGTKLGQWSGAWGYGSPCWEQHPEVVFQVGGEPVKGTGTFWICWQDFRAIFDKVCVLAKSLKEGQQGATPLRRPQHDGQDRSVAEWVLERMADEGMRDDLRHLSVTFDPFASLPAFLDDGTLETRLLWEATKPGRVQAYLDLNRASGNDAGYQLVLDKVKSLGLSAALGKEGCLKGPPAAPAA